jgi:hypothetical protein
MFAGLDLKFSRLVLFTNLQSLVGSGQVISTDENWPARIVFAIAHQGAKGVETVEAESFVAFK